MAKQTDNIHRYQKLIEKIFFDGYAAGITEIPFRRSDLEDAAKSLKIVLPKNLGDVIYSARYRKPMPLEVIRTQPGGMEWVICGAGVAQYQFQLVPINRIKPQTEMLAIKIPDSTPEIIAAYSLSDEQALLAKVRYNRIVDIFMGITAYSLQNHLRTTVKGVGQIEIDEIYVGVDKYGRQFIVPVQAKGGNDQLSVVQTKQDIRCCTEKFPNLICRPISTQFISLSKIAIFELAMDGDSVKIADEKHYDLVPAENITTEDLANYKNRR